MRSPVLALVATVLIWLLTPPSVAQEGWTELDLSSARIVAAQTTVPQDGPLQVGVDIVLDEDWKTYWRSPGDAGYPVTVDWSGSRNAEIGNMQWPAPHRFSLFDLDTFGYGERVVFPFEVAVSDPALPVELNAVVDYLLCQEICVPQVAELSLTLNPGPAQASTEAQLIDLYQSQVPGDGSGAGLMLDAAFVAESRAEVRVAVASIFPFETPDVIVEGPEDFLFGRPSIALSDDGLWLTAVVPAETLDGTPARLSAADLTVTVVDGARGLEGRVRDAALTAAVVPDAAFLSLLGIAFLGGLILNLMPCVLPVLSIKLLSVVSQGGQSPARVRLSFLASAFGILASFWVLALGAIALGALGVAVGWGIQFQNPYFLVFMAVVVAVFAYNLFGMFEIPLPQWMSGAATIGDSESLRGHFLTGVFATLLATPCSAPFVGTAVGFALSSGAPEILAIFTALGLGLAAPFLLVSAFPNMATSMPKPGKWMLQLKKLLSLALAATVVWLLFVIAGVGGAVLAYVIAAGLLSIGAVLWSGRSGAGRSAFVGMATATLAFLLMASPAVFSAGGASEPEAGSTTFAEFTIAERDRRVAAGEVVFVDVTADWCITCQVNKRLALSDGGVRAAIEVDGVIPLRADWTQRDDTILSYLTSHGRYGIPFNAVYGPGAPEGIVLPEILTPGAVLDALREAGR
eukprot:g16970.t1